EGGPGRRGLRADGPALVPGLGAVRAAGTGRRLGSPEPRNQRKGRAGAGSRRTGHHPLHSRVVRGAGAGAGTGRSQRGATMSARDAARSFAEGLRGGLTIRLMTGRDIPAGQRLREQAGWNQSDDDWRRLLAWEPTGCFVGELDGKIVGSTSTTVYGNQLAWIGMVLVDLDHRR